MRAFLLVLAIDSFEIGKMYVGLPLHCTVVHWFRTEATHGTIIDVCHSVFAHAAPIQLLAQAPDMFGHHHNIPVYRVAPSDEILALHNRLLDRLEKMGITHTQPAYARDSFSPHVTTQGEQAFMTGTTFTARNAYVVEAEDAEAITGKRPVAKVTLGGES